MMSRRIERENWKYDFRMNWAVQQREIQIPGEVTPANFHKLRSFPGELLATGGPAGEPIVDMDI